MPNQSTKQDIVTPDDLIAAAHQAVAEGDAPTVEAALRVTVKHFETTTKYGRVAINQVRFLRKMLELKLVELKKKVREANRTFDYSSVASMSHEINISRDLLNNYTLDLQQYRIARKTDIEYRRLSVAALRQFYASL